MREYFAFQWHITDACDQRCKHCYIFSEDHCKAIESMDWRQMQEVVANCGDFCKVYHRLADAFCIAENMVLQATELGIASCIISRGEETFANEEGQRLMAEWGVPANYICSCFVILGYIDGEQPQRKPRKPGRVKIIT